MTKILHPGCDHCNHPMFAAMRCDVCGKVHSTDDEPQQLPTMEDAIAAGDGALHGAIDYWQNRALEAEAKLKAPQQEAVTDVSCPVCGYYCLGKGGFGCVDKPAMLSAAPKAPTTDDRKDAGQINYDAEVSGAGTASAGLPGYAGDNNGEQ